MSAEYDGGAQFVNVVVRDDILFFHQTGAKRTNMPARPLRLRHKDGTYMSNEVRLQLMEAYRVGF